MSHVMATDIHERCYDYTISNVLDIEAVFFRKVLAVMVGSCRSARYVNISSFWALVLCSILVTSRKRHDSKQKNHEFYQKNEMQGNKSLLRIKHACCTIAMFVTRLNHTQEKVNLFAVFLVNYC